MTGKTNTGVIGTVAGTNKVAEAGFTNTRNGVIPTGVFIYAGIGVIAIAFAGVMFLITRKRKDTFR
jgi:hypothetical protein